MKKSSFTSLIAVFASLNVVCDAIIVPQFSSGVWYGLVFLVEPITGIVLGPFAGFLSTLIGVSVGHIITPRGVEEFIFTLGAPIGAMIASLIFQGKWKAALIYYSALLVSYFTTPIAWQLPFVGMWNVYGAYLALIVTIVMTQRKSWIHTLHNKWYFLVLCAFIGLEADILFRIFILIPCRGYQLFYSLPVEVLQMVWISGALITPIKVAVSAFLTVLLGTRVLRILGRYATHERIV